MSPHRHGILAACLAAILFGASAPLAKLLLDAVSPWLLAGLLYLGSGVGLLLLTLSRPARGGRLEGRDVVWLAGAIVAGGMVGPVLLMWGLAHMPASGASLLLNAEGVATALLAWFVFGENMDRRVVLGMGLIVAGTVVLSWPGTLDFGNTLPQLAVLAACLAWAIDNNLTRKVSLADARHIAMLKGLVAGTTNVALAWLAGASLPPPGTALAIAALGFVGYGLSLVLFVIALRHLGTARTGAYFSTAPFVGALGAVALLGEPLSTRLLVAGVLMGLGVWLHLTERHIHEHHHAPMEHEHEHTHDDPHHQHGHDTPVPPGTRHSHRHRHEALTHHHPHFPDAHHRHEH